MVKWQNGKIRLSLILLFFLPGCLLLFSQSIANMNGSLFIIGGGKRPPEMFQRMIRESGVDKSGYVVILPMSSEDDSACYFAQKAFLDAGITAISCFDFGKIQPRPSCIDSITNARLVYIPGGDQRKFMQIVRSTPVYKAIHYVYDHGGMIAGTSAGAAVMSKMMITGDEFKHPQYTGDFKTIEADNIEVAEGLGLVTGVIIDQHFIKRMRMNRLISAVIEHPDLEGIGIDESTAIFVRGGTAEVVGSSQVVVISHHGKQSSVKNGLLGAKDLRLEVYLPGDKFEMNRINTSNK